MAPDISSILLSVYRETLLPEFVEEFGFDSTLRLIEIFGGKSIYVPSPAEVGHLLRAAEIFEVLSTYHKEIKQNESTMTPVVQNLARKYRVTTNEVVDIYKSEVQRRKRFDLQINTSHRGEFQKSLRDTLSMLEKDREFDPSRHTRYRRVSNFKRTPVAA